jgi:hypothetical protein
MTVESDGAPRGAFCCALHRISIRASTNTFAEALSRAAGAVSHFVIRCGEDQIPKVAERLFC